MVMRVVVLVFGGWLAFVSSLPVLAQTPDDFISTASPSDMPDPAADRAPMEESHPPPDRRGFQ